VAAVVLLLAAACGGLALAQAAQEPVIARYTFDDPGDTVADASGKGHTGLAPGCGRAEGKVGQALLLDGEHGMTVESSPDLRFRAGYSVEFWLWLDVAATQAPVNLVSKEKEFLLRFDRQGVGGTLSFYPYVRGSYEPRVRGSVPAAKRWHHVIASYDGATARLFVDGVEHAARREGEITPGDAPLVVGAPDEVSGGLLGRIDELSVLAYAIGPRKALERALFPDLGPGVEPRTQRAFDLTTPADAGLFEPLGAAELKPGPEGLDLRCRHADDGVILRGLSVDVSGLPELALALTSDGGTAGSLAYATDVGVGVVPFVVNADGRRHEYRVDLRTCADWKGRLRALALRPSDRADTGITLSSLRLLLPEECGVRLTASALRPEGQWAGVGREIRGSWLVRNDGAAPVTVAVEIEVAEGVGEAELLTPGQVTVAPGEEHVAQWSVKSPEAGDAMVRARASARGMTQARTCGLRFGETGAAPRFGVAAVLKAGFPRAMDFRHLGPDSVPVHAHNDVLLVDLLGEKIAAARDFKARFPDRVVLMQVNDEANGMWGSWFTVPEGFSRGHGLRWRPEVFPNPGFAGFWLLAPGGTLRSPLPREQGEVTVKVDNPERFRRDVRGKPYLLDVLIYARPGGKADFTRADFATVTAIDEAAGTVSLSRWTASEGREWHAFEAGEAYVAPSPGDIYGVGTGLIKTWLPNLTKFCPRDPRTGENAAEYWAAHFAALYREHIAAGDGPVPDGLQFDWPPFWAHSVLSDCDNDGVADGCQFAGVSYWGLGMHDVFHYLRHGGPGFEGIGEEPLLLADSSDTASQRSFDLLNGSENEEFPAFGGYRSFSSQLDLYLLWCREAREPRLSYLQSRYPCELYFLGGLDEAARGEKFQLSSRLRLNAAAACMGLGVHTYRSGGKEDVGTILKGGGDLEYDLDEHHAGDDGVYGWLGLPRAEPQRLDTAGEVVLKAAPGDYEPLASDQVVQSAPLRVVTRQSGDGGEEVQALEMRVTSMLEPRELPEGEQSSNRVQARRMRAAGALSPPLTGEVKAGEELALTMWVDADPQYDDLEGERYAALKREIELWLADGDLAGPTQRMLVGPTPRRVCLTLAAPTDGRPRLAVGVGAELGPVWIGDVTLRRGCAEVMVRGFEHGVVLMNGSQTAPWEYDPAELFPGRRFERLRGSQCPQVNDGSAVEGKLRVGPLDAAFLREAGTER